MGHPTDQTPDWMELFTLVALGCGGCFLILALLAVILVLAMRRRKPPMAPPEDQKSVDDSLP